jgi:hypothetical protein
MTARGRHGSALLPSLESRDKIGFCNFGRDGIFEAFNLIWQGKFHNHLARFRKKVRKGVLVQESAINNIGCSLI